MDLIKNFTFNFGSWTLITGLEQLTASISPDYSSFLKIGLLRTQTHNLTLVAV